MVLMLFCMLIMVLLFICCTSGVGTKSTLWGQDKLETQRLSQGGVLGRWLGGLGSAVSSPVKSVANFAPAAKSFGAFSGSSDELSCNPATHFKKTCF